jgi:hypothetical protein
MTTILTIVTISVAALALVFVLRGRKSAAAGDATSPGGGRDINAPQNDRV